MVGIGIAIPGIGIVGIGIAIPGIGMVGIGIAIPGIGMVGIGIAIPNWEFALADPKSESGHRRVAVAALGISGLPTNYPGSFAPSNRHTLWNIGVIRDELAVFHYSTDQKVKIRVFDLCSF